MSHFVPESAIDYQAVLSRGGRNLGDEDFALFKCPSCNRIYLMDYEVDTVYLDANDLSKREDVTDPTHPFVCVTCSQPLPSAAWVGPRAEEKYQVTWSELKASAWCWAASPIRGFGDDA